MKRQFSYKEEKQTKVDDSFTAYIRSSDYQGNSGFSDVGLFNVERFFELFSDIDMQKGERIKNKYARENGIYMGISLYPFMMWLPYPISFRGKKRDLFQKIIETIGGCGYYPYNIMDSSKINNLLKRDIENRPYAEDWLSVIGLSDVKIWSFTGGVPNLMARGGFRAKLGGLLYKLNNIFLSINRRYE